MRGCDRGVWAHLVGHDKKSCGSLAARGKRRAPATSKQPAPTVAADDRLTLAEAAELTGLTQGALARRIERGSLPATKNEEGRRTVTRRELASAGLLDLATGIRPIWGRRGDPPADRLAQAILDELNARGVRIFELERGHEEQAAHIEDLRRELREARHERGELRREIEKLRGRLTEVTDNSERGQSSGDIPAVA
jgi:hypothetical protein